MGRHGRRRRVAVLLIGIVAAIGPIAGCSGDSDTPAETTTPSATTTAPPTTTTAPETTTAPPVTSEVATEPAPTPQAAEPTIVGCQMGLGPIETYWSDGTVTGYSDYCQSVHDENLQGEAEANTPVCDGTVCTFPNGATVPDRNADAPVVPAP